MDSYYDTIIEQCRSLMAQGHHAQAQALLEEELSMPYIPKPFEETIIALYNECRSTLRLHGGVVREVHDVEELLKGSVEEQLQAVEQLRSSNIRNHLPAVREAMKQGSSAWVNAFLIEALCEQNVSEEFTLYKIPTRRRQLCLMVQNVFMFLRKTTRCIAVSISCGAGLRVKILPFCHSVSKR